MNGLLQHLRLTLRLHFRNKMALLYGYLFPVIFLIAFWVLYRYERVPLARHLGELLTVTVLGGTCFGLPTTMVSERERGVWRRFRLAPVSTGSLVGSTVAARYIAVLTAGLLQLALAMGIGMPLPRHPIELYLAFTAVTFAFLGLGLVIAMMADNVPAVQALGQCIFLPMLIIGGVAVQLSSLPDWALHVSAFFPGRYAVEAMQACVTGAGLGPVRFSLLALGLIGAAGCLAGAKMFRWDAQQRFSARGGKAWLAVALAGWVGVGLLAEARGHVGIVGQEASAPPTALQTRMSQTTLPVPRLSAAERALAPTAAPPVSSAPAPAPAPPSPGAETPKVAPPAKAGSPPGQTSIGCPIHPSWQAVTEKMIDDEFVFTGLPRDGGVVTPIARDDEQPDQETADKLAVIEKGLPSWPLAKATDPVQRVRNVLYVAAVPDVFQLDIERFVPWYVFDQLRQDIPKDDLVKLLYWVVCNPEQGPDPSAVDMRPLGIPGVPSDMVEVRNRSGIYALKLLGRLLGKIQ